MRKYRTVEPTLRNEVGRRHVDPDIVTTFVAMAAALLIYNVLLRLAESPDTTRLESTAIAAPLEAATTGVLSDGVSATERRLYLEIHPTGPCWISAVADGRPVMTRLLQAGESVTVSARDELQLRVGDPAAFTYTLNGMRGRQVGEAQRPATVVITSSNYQTFVTAASADP